MACALWNVCVWGLSKHAHARTAITAFCQAHSVCQINTPNNQASSSQVVHKRVDRPPGRVAMQTNDKEHNWIGARYTNTHNSKQSSPSPPPSTNTRKACTPFGGRHQRGRMQFCKFINNNNTKCSQAKRTHGQRTYRINPHICRDAHAKQPRTPKCSHNAHASIHTHAGQTQPIEPTAVCTRAHTHANMMCTHIIGRSIRNECELPYACVCMVAEFEVDAAGASHLCNGRTHRVILHFTQLDARVCECVCHVFLPARISL